MTRSIKQTRHEHSLFAAYVYHDQFNYRTFKARPQKRLLLQISVALARPDENDFDERNPIALIAHGDGSRVFRMLSNC